MVARVTRHRPAEAFRWQHDDAPKKLALKAIKGFLIAEDIPHTNRQLFKHCGINERTGYNILNEAERRFNNNSFITETRGRKAVITEAQVDKLEKFLWEGNSEARELPWSNLCDAAGLEWPERSKPPSARTVRRTLQHRDWRRCIICTKAWVSVGTAKRREEYARKILLERGFDWKYWCRIRWSDEIHFTLGHEGKICIIRKPGERYCPGCMQHRESPDREEQICLSAWAAVGYNFKSDLVWYDSNKANDALATYRDQILEPVVGEWLRRGDDFILGENSGRDHNGQTNHNSVVQWKKKHGLESFFNCPGSPDLTPIENAWRAPKVTIRQASICDVDALKELIEESWGTIKQEAINEWVVSMPSRLQDVIALEGQMTRH